MAARNRRSQVIVALVLLFVLVSGVLAAVIRPGGDRRSDDREAVAETTTTTEGADDDDRPRRRAERDDDGGNRRDDREETDADDEAIDERDRPQRAGAELGDAHRIARRRVVVESVTREGADLVVRVTLRNVARRPLPYGPGDFSLRTADGTVVEAAPSQAADALPAGELQPDEEVAGTIRFTAPEGDHTVLFDAGARRTGAWSVSG